MTKLAISICILLAGIINFLPLLAVLSVERIKSSYGVDFSDPTLELLLRHRAVLFGIIGGLMIYGAFRVDLHWLAIITGAVSMVAFILLAGSINGYSDQIRPILTADYIGCGLLFVATVLKVAFNG